MEEREEQTFSKSMTSLFISSTGNCAFLKIAGADVEEEEEEEGEVSPKLHKSNDKRALIRFLPSVKHSFN
jgi:hypothetical protein